MGDPDPCLLGCTPSLPALPVQGGATWQWRCMAVAATLRGGVVGCRWRCRAALGRGAMGDSAAGCRRRRRVETTLHYWRHCMVETALHGWRYRMAEAALLGNGGAVGWRRNFIVGGVAWQRQHRRVEATLHGSGNTARWRRRCIVGYVAWLQRCHWVEAQLHC
jgi:hypothetical protein